MSWGDVWGTSPGRDSVRCAAAFYAGEKFSRGNVSTDGSYYVLWGRIIAERIKPEDLPGIVASKLAGDNLHHYRKLLAFRWPAVDISRYPAVARHFRALGFGYVDEGRWTRREQRPVTIYGKEIMPAQWFTHEELAARPLYEPPPFAPPPKPRFVNPTMELFPS